MFIQFFLKTFKEYLWQKHIYCEADEAKASRHLIGIVISNVNSGMWSLGIWGFPSGSDGKESACSAGDPGLTPGLGRSPGEGNGYPPQYSCLENSMDGGAWQVTVHGVAKSPTWLSDFQFHNESKEDQIDSTHVYWTEIRKLQEL